MQNQNETVPQLAGSSEPELQHFVDQRSNLSRRRLLTTLGLAAGAAGAVALTGCSDNGTIVPANQQVIDVLNFALNLEYLEASFYLFLTTGSGLSLADSGVSPATGPVTGGAKLTFSNPIVASVAQQLATDELEHVQFLRSTISSIGGTPITIPNINLAAMGAVTSDATFLALARQLEAVGISAYAGGAGLLTSSTTAVLYASQILDTEAQHEGFLRQLCINLGVASPAADSMDLPPTSAAIFNTSKTTGLNPARTTSQVLQIVYGAPNTVGITKGGFFPKGLNGNIYSS